MPIYEYESLVSDKGCEKCAERFEIIQGIREEPLSHCPHCGQKVRKVMSRCRVAIEEPSTEQVSVEKKIKDYEKQGMWSHAAELADKQSEKAKNKGMKVRALENYKKAGYDVATLEKHSKINNH